MARCYVESFGSGTFGFSALVSKLVDMLDETITAISNLESVEIEAGLGRYLAYSGLGNSILVALSCYSNLEFS